MVGTLEASAMGVTALAASAAGCALLARIGGRGFRLTRQLLFRNVGVVLVGVCGVGIALSAAVRSGDWVFVALAAPLGAEAGSSLITIRDSGRPAWIRARIYRPVNRPAVVAAYVLTIVAGLTVVAVAGHSHASGR